MAACSACALLHLMRVCRTHQQAHLCWQAALQAGPLPGWQRCAGGVQAAPPCHLASYRPGPGPFRSWPAHLCCPAGPSVGHLQP